MNEILSNKWFKFSTMGGLYLLWVIWLGNFWWLIGLGVIFDITLPKKYTGRSGKRKIRQTENKPKLWNGSMPSFLR